jgi:hypothetical protein
LAGRWFVYEYFVVAVVKGRNQSSSSLVLEHHEVGVEHNRVQDMREHRDPEGGDHYEEVLVSRLRHLALVYIPDQSV